VLIKRKRILQVLDPSHRTWVQGGVFSDLRRIAPEIFFGNCVYLPPPNSPMNFVKWFASCMRIKLNRKVLFSSLTPMENYSRFPSFNKGQNIGIWFTHKDGSLNKSEMRSLSRSNVIFCHSHRESRSLERVTNAKIIVMLAAIDPNRFQGIQGKGNKVLWVGTPAERKNPQIVLDLAKELPNMEFKIVGKDWRHSSLWEAIQELSNVEYIEIDGPLTAEKIEDCVFFLMTSRIEGGPMPLMEALAAGLIPISTDTGFVSELFDIAEVPRDLIVEANVKSFEVGLRTARNLSLNKFTVNSDNIKRLDFKRLAKLIAESLP